jgi:DNA repair protein RadA
MSKKNEMAIEDLPGIGAATAEKLREGGYHDLMAIAVATPGELTESVGMGEASARKVINAARNNLDMGFVSGEDLLKKREQIIRIKTGSTAFDELVNGGFESGGITECFGQYGSGKCCHKNTKLFYFNSSKPHLETLEQVYYKYKSKYGEKKVLEGSMVEVPPVVVMGFSNNQLSKVQASHIYREKVEKMYKVKTRRGRELIVTGPHKLLSFNEGVQWTPASKLQINDAIAYPRKIVAENEVKLSEDDAFFMGLYVAEGCRNSTRLTTGSNKLKNWVVSYLQERFDFEAYVYLDKKSKVFTIYLRKCSEEVLGELTQCTAGTKFVPEELYHAPENVVKSFLAGYIDGDGHYGKNFEVTTKSKELSEGLTYLFLRIGISTTLKKKKVKGDIFWRISVASEDAYKLNDLPGKIKSAKYSGTNTSFGSPKKFNKYIRSQYQKSLGGNRGLKQKLLGKSSLREEMFYSYLTNKSLFTKSMNLKTIKRMQKTFQEGETHNQEAIKLAEKLESLSHEEFKKLYQLLPFPFNTLHKSLGVKKSTMSNYIQRGLPKRDKKKMALLKESLVKELQERRKELVQALGTIKNVIYFNWDTVESIDVVDYNDFVYDIVVPEGHCFVGGNIPTILHNTAIANQLAINALYINEEGEPTAYTVWIDSENTFRPERIKQICEQRGYDPIKVLQHIKVVRAFNSDHQMMCAEKVEDLIQKEELNVKLIIVDSLMSHFRSEFIGRGTLANRQQKINKHMHTLMKLADQYNLAVYVTNQVMAKPDTFFGDPTQAIGGNIVAHNSTTRLYLRRGKKGTRVAKLVDSPYLPDGECVFQISDKGIEDV